MKAVICTVAYGGWYRKGLERQIREFERVSPGYELQAWLNVLPPGTPTLIENGYDYTGYAAKPHAMLYAFDHAAEIVLLIDASVYPIRHIEPLLDHIGNVGYYLAPSGFSAGEWTSDQMLSAFGVTRDAAMAIPGVQSGIVGLRRDHSCISATWSCWASHFPGAHSNDAAADRKHHYRNVGHVSDDPRCRGHRHDQAALTLIAHGVGLTNLVHMPKFVDYEQHRRNDPETLLLVAGM